MLGSLSASVHTIFSDSSTYFIPASAVVSILFAIWLWGRVAAIRVAPATHTRSENGREYLLEEEQRGEDEVQIRAYAVPSQTSWDLLSFQLQTKQHLRDISPCDLQVVQKAADLQDAIAEGANSFLFTEYKYMAVFMVFKTRGFWCLLGHAAIGPSC